MKWYEESARKLEENRIYSHQELVQILQSGFPMNSANSFQWGIAGLIEQGRVVKIGYNQYGVASGDLPQFYQFDHSELVKSLIQAISQRFPDSRFVLAETLQLEEFLGNPVSRNTVFVQVGKGLSLDVFRYLQDRRIPNLMHKPSYRDYERYRTMDSIVVAELISEAPICRQCPHEICIEKLLVDANCDRLWKSEYAPDEFLSIVERAEKSYIVDKTRLLRYARRRGKEEAIMLAAPVLILDDESESEKRMDALLNSARKIVYTLPLSQRAFFNEIKGSKVSQAQFAKYYGVSPLAITNRINRLFKTIMKRLETEYGYTEEEAMRLTRSKTPLSFIRKITL